MLICTSEADGRGNVSLFSFSYAEDSRFGLIFGHLPMLICTSEADGRGIVSLFSFSCAEDCPRGLPRNENGTYF